MMNSLMNSLMNNSLVNPFALRTASWFVGFFLSRFAVMGMEQLLSRYATPRQAKRTQKEPCQDLKCVLFLVVNSAMEWCLFQHMLRLTMQVQHTSFTLWSTVVTCVVMFYALDAVYMPVHWALHRPCIYQHIHKHHHRNVEPYRGYTDAAAVHPVEHLLGIACTWCALNVGVAFGAHSLTLLAFVVMHGVFAIANHTWCDVRILWYDNSDHALHHILPQWNFAQYCTVYDKVCGTYKSYDSAYRANGFVPPAID